MSVLAQKEQDWVCYITDDMSTDASAEIAMNYERKDKRFVYIRNYKKMYQPGNYWQCIHRPEIDDNDIVITLDGDDWFSDREVLTRMRGYYSNPNIWAVFGQFMMFTDNPSVMTRGWTQRPCDDWSAIRQVGWYSTHLRTCRAFLMKNIKEEHLKAPSGNFWEMTGDQAVFFPVLEQAGKDRVLYTEDINMIYNGANPLNDHKVDVGLQRGYEQLIRKTIPIYKQLP